LFADPTVGNSDGTKRYKLLFMRKWTINVHMHS
jgi:hypothetical protein